MSEPFDPYRKWLGIPPQHQPPHHYRLLGIEAFESDPDVIANAADGRMAQVKTFQTGKNSDASQRILNELAAAKVCLLNPEKKADYDRRLREAIRAEQAAQAPPPAEQVPEALPAGPPPMPPHARAPALPFGAAPPSSGFDPYATVPAAPPTTPRYAPPPASEFDPYAMVPAAPPPASEFDPYSMVPAAPPPASEFDPYSTAPAAPPPASEFDPYATVPAAPPPASEFDPYSTAPAAPPTMPGYGPAPASASDIYSLAQSPPPRMPMPAAPPDDAIEQIVGPGEQTRSPDGGSFVDYASPSFADSAGAGAAAGRSPAKKRIVKKSQSENWQIPAVAIGVGLLLVVILVIWAANQGDERPKEPKKGEEGHKAQVEEERIIPYHAPKPTPTPSPSRADKTPLDSDLPAANVAPTPQPNRPHVAVSPDGTQSDSESMMPTTDNKVGPEMPPEKNKPAPAPVANQKKLPIPAEDQQEKAEAKIKDIYKNEFAAAKSSDGRLDLASKLCEAGVNMSDDATAKFVLWRLAVHEAAEAGSLAKATEVIDKIGQAYEVDAAALKADAVSAAVDALRPGAGTVALARDLATTAMKLAEGDAAADRFDVARRVALLAKRAMGRVNDNQFKREIFERNKEIERQKKRYDAVAEALKKIAANPADADANLALGRWHCFVKGNWEKGLPMLVKGKDADLSAAAKQDLAGPKDPKAQMDLGDAWWALSEKEPAPGKAAVLARAVRWYNEALPKLTGLDKAKVERRVKSLSATSGKAGK